jgi:hypothetical protein
MVWIIRPCHINRCVWRTEECVLGCGGVFEHLPVAIACVRACVRACVCVCVCVCVCWLSSVLISMTVAEAGT